MAGGAREDEALAVGGGDGGGAHRAAGAHAGGEVGAEHGRVVGEGHEAEPRVEARHVAEAGGVFEQVDGGLAIRVGQQGLEGAHGQHEAARAHRPDEG
ncbi:MAG: hypothetical protein ACK559_06810, partial [bacterium]